MQFELENFVRCLLDYIYQKNLSCVTDLLIIVELGEVIFLLLPLTYHCRENK